jgi:hypothetical protein
MTEHINSSHPSIETRPKIAEVRYRNKMLSLASGFFSFGCACGSTALGVGFPEQKVFMMVGGSLFCVSAGCFLNWARVRYFPEAGSLAGRFIQKV